MAVSGFRIIKKSDELSFAFMNYLFHTAKTSPDTFVRRQGDHHIPWFRCHEGTQWAAKLAQSVPNDKLQIRYSFQRSLSEKQTSELKLDL